MAIKPLTLLNGTVADANEVEAIFLPLYTDIAPINVDVPNKLGTGRFVLESALTDATTPVGTIVAFYDFNGAATFDLTIWNYCDGSAINSPGSPIDGQILPDLSGRYIVGFGTIGGGNIDTAPFDAAPVGIVDSQLDLQHAHTVNNHSHTMPAHTHGPGDLEFNVIANDGVNIQVRSNNGAVVHGLTLNLLVDGPGAISVLSELENGTFTTWAGQGLTDPGGNGNTGNAAPGTNQQLLNNVDIRPSSIRVRFIMKIN